MTASELEPEFAGEWVLLADPEFTDGMGELVSAGRSLTTMMCAN